MSEILVTIITAILIIQIISGVMILVTLSPYPNFNELFSFVSMLFGTHYHFIRKLRVRRLNRIGAIIACTAYYIFVAPAAILWFIVALLMDICRIALKLFFWIFRERENFNE